MGERLKKNDSETWWYFQNFSSCTVLTRASALCVMSVTAPEVASSLGMNICTRLPSSTRSLTASSMFCSLISIAGASSAALRSGTSPTEVLPAPICWARTVASAAERLARPSSAAFSALPSALPT